MKLSDNEILSNYNFLKKLEQVLPLKKAEIESEFWKALHKKLEKEFGTIKFYSTEELIEKLTSNYADLIELTQEFPKIKKNFRFGLGRDKKQGKERVFIYVIPEDFSEKDWEKFNNFGKQVMNWHLNQCFSIFDNIFKDKIPEVFSFNNNTFYKLLDSEFLEEVIEIVVKIVKTEVENIKKFS